MPPFSTTKNNKSYNIIAVGADNVEKERDLLKLNTNINSEKVAIETSQQQKLYFYNFSPKVM